MASLVALCGIDGTGKTTQAELLRDRLRTAGWSAELLWCRWDPVLARPAVRLLGWLARQRTAAPQPSGSPHDAGSGGNRRAVRRRLLSVPLIRRLWTALMVLDYGLQVAPKVSKARRSADIVIVDRYRHDVMIDLSAGEDLAPTPKILRRTLPEPDLILVLDVDEEVAFARKPDSPDLTYLEQRRHLYRQVAEQDHAVLIDASDSTEVVSKLVFDAVNSQLDVARRGE